MLALGLVAAPSCVRAQDQGTNNADSAASELLGKPIDLDVRSANLYYALSLLFDQLKGCNYTIPDALKHLEISARFTHLPLRTALETILKNSGYTYKVDGGVISIVPHTTGEPLTPLDVTAESTEAAPRQKKIFRLAGNQVIYNSVDVVTRLGGRVLPGAVGLQQTGRAALGGGNGLGSNGRLGGGLGGFNGGTLGSGLGGVFGSSGFGEGGGAGPGNGVGPLQGGGPTSGDGGRRRGGGGF